MIHGRKSESKHETNPHFIKNSEIKRSCFGKTNGEQISFEGKIANISFMPRIVNKSEMELIENCLEQFNDKIIMNFLLKDVIKINVSEDVCNDRYILYEYKDNPMSYFDARSFQSHFDGGMINEENTNLMFNRISSYCSSATDYRTWIEAAPNTSQSDFDYCKVLRMNGNIDLIPCIFELDCIIFKLSNAMQFKLHGRARDFDREYNIISNQHSLILKGSKSCQIVKKYSDWVLESNIIRTTWVLSSHSLPFGRHYWISSKNENKTLALSHCQNNSMYCSDGYCIPESKRCDGTTDCNDFSDEKECEFIVKYPGFVIEQPPPYDESDPERKFMFYVSIFSIANIITTNGIAEIDMSIYIWWRDSRLILWNANDNQQVIDCNTIWFPKLNLALGHSRGHNLHWKSYNVDCIVSESVRGLVKSYNDPYMGKLR